MKKKSVLLIVIVLAFLGLPLTIYLTFLHYKPEASTFCNFNDQFNCDIVNKSVYSEILGIPIAIFGFFTYLLIFIIAYHKYVNSTKKNKVAKDIKFTKYLLILGLIAFLFSLYLTFLEAFVIFSWCIFCIISAVLITIIFLLSIIIWRKKW
ncbi:MAG TPA: vitamin K epoxide reductase family protein [Candidatus Nanoarchaeia archaeon]|nr:vitamin K epoxide reductase family protein [Candidatus Nanoarchaeia archaeon]